jgi:hypothetical protein
MVLTEMLQENNFRKKGISTKSEYEILMIYP